MPDRSSDIAGGSSSAASDAYMERHEGGRPGYFVRNTRDGGKLVPFNPNRRGVNLVTTGLVLTAALTATAFLVLLGSISMGIIWLLTSG